MDITLIRTFLEVLAAGSFGGAAERLSITQSAVSLRIQRLEETLGTALLSRSKAGAVQTPAGKEFERYALSMLNIWEEARLRVAVPEGFTKSLSIGAEHSLWPRLGFRLIDGLRIVMPDLALRADFGTPEALTRLMVEGMLHVTLMYTPTLRPGLMTKRLLDDELILVASWPDPKREDLPGRYIYSDWGPEFVHQHARHLPELSGQGFTAALGALTAEFISRREFGTYLPARQAKRYCDSGLLYRVEGAPRFPFPVWWVWREDLDPALLDAVERVLAKVVSGIDLEVDQIMNDFVQLTNGQG
ncbi:MAG: LysR family transcriptional regulator [Albidovulum sp.]